MLYLLGKTIAKSQSNLIFESNYIGYIIKVSNVDRYEINKFQKIFVYEHKNEYVKAYYGFKEFKERVIFEDLLTVQGIGPKTAMVILSKNWKQIMTTIANGDYDELAKIPYVGLRTAKQIVFDFQRKYKNMIGKNIENNSKNMNEVFKTLKTLGFNEDQINLVSNKLKDTNDIDQMIEKAIEIISHEQQSNIVKA